MTSRAMGGLTWTHVFDEQNRLKQVIADIEEEARMAGVPHGWLR